MSQTHVTSKRADKYNGFHYPLKKVKSTRWAIHIYDIINEANPELLKRSDVQTAYNNLIQCLRSYDGFFESWIPKKDFKYDVGIKMVESSLIYLGSIPGRFIFNPNISDYSLKTKTAAEDIIKTYLILYELIKRDVVPYMEIKHHETTCQDKIKAYCLEMINIENKIKKLHELAAQYQNDLCRISQKIEEIQKPPKITVFD